MKKYKYLIYFLSIAAFSVESIGQIECKYVYEDISYKEIFPKDSIKKCVFIIPDFESNNIYENSDTLINLKENENHLQIFIVNCRDLPIMPEGKHRIKGLITHIRKSRNLETLPWDIIFMHSKVLHPFGMPYHYFNIETDLDNVNKVYILVEVDKISNVLKKIANE